MRNNLIGVFFGIIAGLIDLIPMFVMHLSWEANLSAFLMWIVISIFVVNIKWRIHGAVLGVIVSYLVLLPSAIIIGSQDPLGLVPILGMTTILGAAIGTLIKKYTE